MVRDRTPRRRPPLGCLLLFSAATFAGALLISELSFRAAGLVQPPWFYRLDKTTGHALREDARGWFRQEGRAFVEISDQGLRDVSHERSRSPGVTRIAVLGDSFAEAMQVDLEETFWRVLRRELETCSPGPVEVVNFGVSDFGTAQELLQLRARVWDYEPDIVLLAFFSGNDIRNNSRALDNNPNRPYFELRNGELELDEGFHQWQERRGWYAELVSRFVVLQLFDRVRSSWRAPDEQAADSALGDAEVFAPPRDPEWVDAWAVTEALLGEMHEDARRHDARFVVATLTHPMQVHPNASARRAFMDSLGVEDLGYPDRRIADLGARLGFRVANLARRLRAHVEATGASLHGFDNAQLHAGHWNVDGHRLAGVELMLDLCPEL